jgi:hypothetical protein
MIRAETDFNRMEGPGTLFIANATKKIPEEYRREGTHILFFDREGGLECQAVLRRGPSEDFWLAAIVDGTLTREPD